MSRALLVFIQNEKVDTIRHASTRRFWVFRSAAVYQCLLQVPHQPRKRVYFDAATVQQQPRFKLFPL